MCSKCFAVSQKGRSSVNDHRASWVEKSRSMWASHGFNICELFPENGAFV